MVDTINKGIINMTTRMKLLALVTATAMYGVFAACGGGDDSGGSSTVQAQVKAQCLTAPGTCSDGSQALKATVDNPNCPYYCGDVNFTSSTVTNTVTATTTVTTTTTTTSTNN
jgi:hypothetical protein